MMWCDMIMVQFDSDWLMIIVQSPSSSDDDLVRFFLKQQQQQKKQLSESVCVCVCDWLDDYCKTSSSSSSSFVLGQSTG